MRLNCRGFSLIEVMVAAGIMMIVALGFATMMTNGNKELRYVETKLEAVQLRNQLVLSMTNEKYCACAFKGLTMNPTDLATAVIEPNSFFVSYSDDGLCTKLGGAPIFKSNTQIPSSKLFLGQMRVSSFVPGANAGDYIGKLVVPIDQSKTQVVRSFKDLEFPLRVTLDMANPNADKPILTCTANSAAAPPSVAAFSSDYCYAKATGKGGGGSCDDGFYLKSVFAYDDDNWQGVGTVCCYGSTGAPPAAQVASLKASASNLCVGCNYNEVVTDCNINKDLYGPNAGTTCPSSPSISWGAWMPKNLVCNTGICGIVKVQQQKTCVGSGCPNPATVTRMADCFDSSACPPPDAP